MCTSHETTDCSNRTLSMNSLFLCCTTCCTSRKNSFPFPLHSPFFFSSYSSVSYSFLGFWLFLLMVICSLSFFRFFFQSFFPFFRSFLLNTLSPSFLFSSFSLFSFSFLSFSDLNTFRKTCPMIHLFSGSSLLPALFLLVRFLLGCNIILHSSSLI